jgi:phospholipid N-methyltransferase
MNTHTHALLTAAVARRRWPRDAAKTRFATAGAVLPDVPYWALATTMLRRTGRLDLRGLGFGTQQRWLPDMMLHSFVPPAILLLAGRLTDNLQVRGMLTALATGWAGHNLTDLPVHSMDARPHLWPLSNRRWQSPLSGSERAHHAVLVQAVEAVLAAWAVASLRQDAETPALRRDERARRRREVISLFTTFARHPLQVGAVMPTSRSTVEAMLDMVKDWDQVGCVVELGAGTGVFTKGILDRVGRDAKVTSFEKDGRLAAYLDATLPDPRLTVAHADAVDLRDHLGSVPADVIVSALPLTSLPKPVRIKVLDVVAGSLTLDGTFLQIQYSHARRHDLQRHFEAVRWRRATHNLPPAILYCCEGARREAPYAGDES